MTWFCCLCFVIALFLVNLRPAPEAKWTDVAKAPRSTVHRELTMPERRDHYRADVPLSRELQETLHNACSEYRVPVALALALIELESGFQAGAVGPDGHDIGLYQLRTSNHAWLQAETGADPLTPDGNIKCGVWLIGYLLERYDSTEAALTAYRYGHDNGTRGYANAVLEAAENWEAIQ